MITKMHLSPLDSFKPIVPSKGQVPNECTLSVGKKRIHMNKECFKHFKGHHYFKFMLRGSDLAIVESDKKDPDAIRINSRHSQSDKEYSYSSLFNKGIHSQIVSRLGVEPGHHALRLEAKNHDHPNYLIFDIRQVD